MRFSHLKGDRGMLPEGVVNEMCDCGHTIDCHAPWHEEGHGPCCVTICKCRRFTWYGFVNELGEVFFGSDTEKARAVPSE